MRFPPSFPRHTRPEAPLTQSCKLLAGRVPRPSTNILLKPYRNRPAFLAYILAFHLAAWQQGSASSAESRVLATFLTEMDGVGSLRGDGVVVVGATNRPEAVDRALLRPGRFDQVVYAPLPDSDARRQVG